MSAKRLHQSYELIFFITYVLSFKDKNIHKFTINNGILIKDSYLRNLKIKKFAQLYVNKLIASSLPWLALILDASWLYNQVTTGLIFITF